jgi:hypothetical protein
MANKKWMAAALALGALLIGSQPTSATAASPSVWMVYDEGLRNDFIDTSWSVHALDHHGVVHSGRSAIEMQPNRDDGLYLYKDRVAFVNQYDTLQFWVNGGSAGGQDLTLTLQTGGVPVAVKSFQDLLPGGIPAGQWAKVELNLAELGIPNGIFDGILIRGNTAGAQPSVYFDDIALYNKASVTPMEPVNGLTVYDDYLNQPTFIDYSIAGHDVTQSAYAHTGLHAVQMTPDRDRGLYFYKDRVASTANYGALRFWVNGGSAGGQQLKLVILSGGVPVAEKSFADLLPNGIPANDWAQVQLSLTDLNLPYGLFDGLLITGTTDGVQDPVYVDDMVLLNL